MVLDRRGRDGTDAIAPGVSSVPKPHDRTTGDRLAWAPRSVTAPVSDGPPAVGRARVRQRGGGGGRDVGVVPSAVRCGIVEGTAWGFCGDGSRSGLEPYDAAGPAEGRRGRADFVPSQTPFSPSRRRGCSVGSPPSSRVSCGPGSSPQVRSVPCRSRQDRADGTSRAHVGQSVSTRVLTPRETSQRQESDRGRATPPRLTDRVRLTRRRRARRSRPPSLRP